jgi:hypothetical protein
MQINLYLKHVMIIAFQLELMLNIMLILKIYVGFDYPSIIRYIEP